MMVLTGLTLSAFAGTTKGEAEEKAALEQVRTTMKERAAAVEYTEEALKGTQVQVSFLINDDNAVQVVRVHGDNKALTRLVTDALENTQVNAPALKKGQVYKIRFSYNFL